MKSSLRLGSTKTPSFSSLSHGALIFSYEKRERSGEQRRLKRQGGALRGVDTKGLPEPLPERLREGAPVMKQDQEGRTPSTDWMHVPPHPRVEALTLIVPGAGLSGGDQ